jgi:hypothetical protein
VFRDLGNTIGEAAVLGALGRVYRLQGQPSPALERLRSARALTERAGDRHGLARCLRELGQVSANLGDLAQARAHWQRALAIFEELGVPEAAEVRALLAPEPLVPDLDAR